MDQRTPSQLELFSASNLKEESNSRSERSFLGYIRGYEKVILSVILYITTGITAYCLGVEKGKAIVAHQAKSTFDQAKAALPPKQLAQPLNQAPLAIKAPLPPAPVKAQGSLLENYSIQIATYQTRKNAEKAALDLKKKGLSTWVCNKGRFAILCVGKFNDKESAKPVLSELKKQYRDCFIRRI